MYGEEVNWATELSAQLEWHWGIAGVEIVQSYLSEGCAYDPRLQRGDCS
jgi:hypothetical protein